MCHYSFWRQALADEFLAERADVADTHTLAAYAVEVFEREHGTAGRARADISAPAPKPAPDDDDGDDDDGVEPLDDDTRLCKRCGFGSSGDALKCSNCGRSFGLRDDVGLGLSKDEHNDGGGTGTASLLHDPRAAGVELAALFQERLGLRPNGRMLSEKQRREASLRPSQDAPQMRRVR
jgi:hypothetical protein